MGPYLARNNDASILNHILETNVEDIRGWIQEDDVFIVDRGFRDSAAYLEKLGIKAEMPAFMTRGESQMSTDSVNTSRLVTKLSPHSSRTLKISVQPLHSYLLLERLAAYCSDSERSDCFLPA
ncbi:hypothetical protein FSP39_003842 [Pinctada imbricata]|uniref:DDE Tnp4 domain-containing protein n=1 Tax=Pinctada imbricata TaxID=66713 RepID=A0AA88Y793_PINIB|nr:hypothetical protein FSP39_003842 [Pinctada imbricata]